MTANEILTFFDEQFDLIHHDPPHLYQIWTHVYPADTRLTVFRSSEQWAVFFEFIGYWCGSQSVHLDIWRYDSGEGRSGAKFEATPFLLLNPETGEALRDPSSLNPAQIAILWNERRYDFSPSEMDYAEAGVVFDPERFDPAAHTAAQIVRYLCERLGHPFFLAEDDLRRLIVDSRMDESTPEGDGMALFLQTRSWRHPDLSLEEQPSQTTSFPILARAIASGDLSEWQRQDPARFNTDWHSYDWAEKSEEEQRREWEEQQDQVWESLPPDARARLESEADRLS